MPPSPTLPPDVPHEPAAVAEHVERRVLELRREMAAIEDVRRTPVRELLATVATDPNDRRELLEAWEDGSRPVRSIWGSRRFQEAALAYAARRRADVEAAAGR